MGVTPVAGQSFTFTTGNGGTVTMLTDGSFSYTPLPGFTGADTFTYADTEVGLSGGTSAPATVEIDVAFQPTQAFVNTSPMALGLQNMPGDWPKFHGDPGNTGVTPPQFNTGTLSLTFSAILNVLSSS